MKNLCVFVGLSGIVFSALAQGSGVGATQGEVMKQLLAGYEIQAKGEAAKSRTGQFKAFSAEAGREFYLKRRTWKATDPTCSGCHTDNPMKEGKHIETKLPIKALAPAANPDRFTDVAKVEKNFSDHCVDLLGRYCEAREKGNFLAYLMSIK